MSDKIVWKNLKNGDKSALEHIYRTYFEVLFQYGKKFTVDQSTIEDCIQTLFIELWNKRENLSETDSIKPYLFLALKRKIIRTVSKIRKSTDKEIEDGYFDLEVAVDESIIADESSQIDKAKLQQALDKLSDRQKEILYLKYHANLDYEEIIEIMDLNYQSARNLVSRALAKLAKVWMLLFILWTIQQSSIWIDSNFIYTNEYKMDCKVFCI